MKSSRLLSCLAGALCIVLNTSMAHCDSLGGSEEPVVTPMLSVDPKSLDFGEEETRRTFRIQNTGDGILEWGITNDQGWISATLTGRIAVGDTDQVAVMLIREGLPPGRYEGAVHVMSNGGEDTVSITMGVPGDLSLGIFSETALDRLLPDVDSFIGAFSGLGASFDVFVADSVEKVEGLLSLKSSLSVDASTDGFAGWFVSWGDSTKAGDDTHVRDMSAFAGGRLVFSVKSLIDLEVGIRSGNIAAGRERSKVLLSDFPSFGTDNTWHQVCVPLAEFERRDPRTDLSQIKVFFVIASNRDSGGTGGVSETFWLDDVRWEKPRAGPPCS